MPRLSPLAAFAVLGFSLLSPREAFAYQAGRGGGESNTYTSSKTFTNVNGILVRSSVTASAFFGSGGGVTNITAANIAAGTAGVSITGNAATVTNGAYINAANVFTADQTHTNSAITLNGVSGSIVSGASVTASAFFGNGSSLTGIAGVLSGGVSGYGGKWSGATSLGTGIIFDSGTAVSIAGGFTVQGATFSAAATGVMSAPSQPGASLYMTANKTFPVSSMTDIYWSLPGNIGSWSQGGVFNATVSSNTLTAVGAGRYFVNCCVNAIVTAASYLYVVIREPASTAWASSRSQNPASIASQTVCASNILTLTNGASIVCSVQSDVAQTIISGNGDTHISFMKIW